MPTFKHTKLGLNDVMRTELCWLTLRVLVQGLQGKVCRDDENFLGPAVGRGNGGPKRYPCANYRPVRDTSTQEIIHIISVNPRT